MTSPTAAEITPEHRGEREKRTGGGVYVTITSDERYWTTEQVADVFAVKPKTVRRWIDHGQVYAIKLNRQWRIASSEIERLLRECRHAG